MHAFFYPERVVIVGVSEAPTNFGNYIMKSLMQFDFKGSYYAVGRKPGTVHGRPIYRSVLDVPDEIDLAMVLVRAEDVPAVAEECGEKGIKRLVITTAGFSEYRPENVALESRLLETCQRYGIRVIGPNCMAVANLDNGLFLPFGPQRPVDWRKGPVGIISQSGMIAMSYAKHLAHAKVGVSKLASIGNKLDVDEVDLLEYYLGDPDTQIVFLYLEGLSRGRELFELACSTTKPILVHKANIGPVSHGIAKSHTTALASDEKVVDAAFEHAGVIRIWDLDELLNCVKVLLLPPLRGDRLVCISPGGGTAVVSADECHRNGFSLPALPQDLLEWMQGKSRVGYISLTNPIDLGDIYDMDVQIEIIERTRKLPGIDGVFHNFGYSLAWGGFFSFHRMFEYYGQVNVESEKPVFVRLDADTPDGLAEVSEKMSVPFFDSIPGTFEAIRRVADVRRTKPVPIPIADFRIDPSGEIASALEAAIHGGKTFMDHEAYRILAKAGIPTVKGHYLPREEVDRIGELRLDFPVVLKAVGDELFHKTEAGGVRLDLKDRGELLEALAVMIEADRVRSARGFLIQEMITQGTEVIVGGMRDPHFGPVVMVGLGGILVEVLSDINLALAPVDMRTARRMVESLKGYEVLKGFRASTPADVDSLCKIIKRVSDLMALFPAIDEIDINPLKVLDQGEGSMTVDCKIFLNPHGNP